MDAKQISKNVFQLSTLRALAVILSAFGLAVPEPVIAWGSSVVLGAYGAWEAFRDGNKG